MAGLLSGLEQFGLGNLENMNLYDDPKKDEKEEGKASKQPQEQDFLFDKTWTCPICGTEFKARTVKVGKVKLLGTDLDLRARYDQVDIVKYDIVSCPVCGYTALSRFFKYVTSAQAKNVKAKISANFRSQTEEKEVYTYEEALERYKLALANAVVKQAKNSEKAYICLKTAWLLRGAAEHLDPDAPDFEEKKQSYEDQENEYLHSAMDGFISARQNESFPMCGMDESTVDYLISVIAMRFEQYDIASRLISGILGSPGANPRTKDKAREVKEMLVKKIRAKNAAQKS